MPDRPNTLIGKGTHNAYLHDLGFTVECAYADGVTRLHRWVSIRIELVAFVDERGRCPNGIQVWIDGLPQDHAAISDRVYAGTAV